MSDVATVPLSALRPVNSPFRQGLGRAGSGVGASSAQGQPQGDYARGYADGLAAAAAQADDGNHAAEMIRRAIHDLRAEPAEELGLYIAEAVTRIVRQIVGETQISADEITRRAHAAAALIAEGATGAFFKTRVALLNPGSTTATVLVLLGKPLFEMGLTAMLRQPVNIP